MTLGAKSALPSPRDCQELPRVRSESRRILSFRLGRSVALRFLPEAVAQDRERVTRFQREAQALASLNPPNIARFYGF